MGESSEPQGVNPAVAALHKHGLTWFPEAGVGYFECVGVETVYDAAYFARYAAQAETPIGRKLNAFRAELVVHHAFRQLPSTAAAHVLDVGIGDGAFVRALRDHPAADQFYAVAGYDVNPAGVAWLHRQGLWGDLYSRTWPIATFWDALEHIRNPGLALDQVETLAIVSIPTFRDVDHVLASRHYRRDEHYWYWTRAGFLAFASSCGFRCVDILATETAIGREDIETFVLVRRGDGEGPGHVG
jgi:hypothetical protein